MNKYFSIGYLMIGMHYIACLLLIIASIARMTYGQLPVTGFCSIASSVWMGVVAIYGFQVFLRTAFLYTYTGRGLSYIFLSLILLDLSASNKNGFVAICIGITIIIGLISMGIGLFCNVVDHPFPIKGDSAFINELKRILPREEARVSTANSAGPEPLVQHTIAHPDDAPFSIEAK
eukprot:TRINITY_DN2715_c0_g1_i1.p1 TRINITY_DN2715_c0_g1~~TRINITY_DN2715_c0_g1_i1.p1  ORF type:complete len:176 (-),score=27.78 TRINITY_DN2715_c0_g1_i1:50-577(-)